MSRFARRILFASVIALHAVVSLCGQCLHEFAGSSHQLGMASKAHGPEDPARSPRDSADNCLICHFVAQGQLPVECCSQISVSRSLSFRLLPFLPPVSSTPISRQARALPRYPFKANCREIDAMSASPGHGGLMRSAGLFSRALTSRLSRRAALQLQAS